MSNKLNAENIYLCPTDVNEIDINAVSYYESVVAQQDHICGIIGAPTTIIQFRKTESRYWERIDSKVSDISLRTSCDILRRCVRDECEYCVECDNLHADLFHGLSETNLKQTLEIKIRAEIGSIRSRFKKQDHEIHVDTHECDDVERVYIHYKCPMFGYNELLFPIFFEGGIIAVIFLGQIKLKGSRQSIVSAKNQFFRNNPGIFKEYVALYNSDETRLKNDNKEAANEKGIWGHIISESVREANRRFPYILGKKAISEKGIIRYVISESVREVNPRFPDLFGKKDGMLVPSIEDELTVEAYEKTKEEICKWLSSFETALISDMKQKREIHVNNLLDLEISRFHKDSTFSICNEEQFNSLRKHIKQLMDRVVDGCGLKSIVVYSTSTVLQKNINKPLAELANPCYNLP